MKLSFNRKTSVGLFFLGLVLVAGALLFGCLGGGEQTQTQNKTMQAVGGGSKASASATPIVRVASVPSTNRGKIVAAYADGKISKTDYAFLSLQALFEPNALPSAYAGENERGADVEEEVMILKENWGSLTPEQQAKISEWVLLTPAEVAAEKAGAKNIEDLLSGKASQSGGVGASELFFDSSMIEEQADRVAVYLDVVEGKFSIRVFLPKNYSTQQLQDALRKMEVVGQGAKDSWPKFKDLLELEPTKTVYVYLKPLANGTLGEATITTEDWDPVARCRLTVDVAQQLNSTGGVDEKRVKSTTAHELFHCFQYYVPLTDWGNAPQKWLREATATWSENYVYPEYNREQFYVSNFFSTRHVALVERFGLKEYADYLLFVFLQQQAGGPETIAAILKNAKTSGVVAALTAVSEWSDQHSEFSVWNWNQDPVWRYNDVPSFPKTPLAGLAIKTYSISDDGELPVMFNIANGSAEYQKFDIPLDGSMDKLTFTFFDTGENAKKHQRRALLRFGSESSPSWREEYWKEDEKTLCLKGEYENLGQIVLVYSNSELDKPFDTSYVVSSEGECPVEVVGKTIQRWTMSTNLPGQSYSETGTFTSRDEIEYDDDEGAYVIRKRSASCTESSSGRVDQELPGGARFQVTTSSSASGEIVDEYSGENRPIKISFEEEENKFNFIVTPGEFNNPKWVKNVITENGATRTEERGCGGALGVVNVLEFPMELPYYSESDGVRRVRGTKEFSYNGITGTMEFDYVVTDKPPQ